MLKFVIIGLLAVLATAALLPIVLKSGRKAAAELDEIWDTDGGDTSDDSPGSE